MYITTGLSDVRTAPRLIGQEVQPRDRTFYVEIDLKIGKTAKPITGIFCPEAYRPAQQVDLIIYLHGYKKDENEKWYPDLTIDRYWANGSFPHYYFPLREEVNASGKNVILIAPTLGQKSESGNLAREFDSYVDKVMDVLGTYGPYQKAQPPPALGNIILACHSGGGSPMLRIALSRNRTAANIQECWGFDCLYSGFKDNIRKPENKLFSHPKRWIEWARSNHAKKLFIFYRGSTKQESEYLRARKPSNISVEGSKAQNHFWVPLAHWRDLIRSASFLSNR